MKAIILAAGKATRLLPLTKDIPQCLLKIKNKTILEMQLDTLAKSGVKEVVVATGHLSPKIEDFAKGKRVKVLFNPFYSVSGMLMTLWVARWELKDGFIMLYSDLVFDMSILRNLLQDKHDICLAIKKDGIREEAEKVNEMGSLVTKIGKMGIGKANAEFIGIAKFSKNGAELFVEEVERIAKKDINAQFIDAIGSLIGRGTKIYTCDIVKAKFVDIDFEKDLKLADELFSKL